MEKTIEQIKNDIAELIRIQSQSGIWDFHPYMHGMLNGMLLIQGIVLDQEPQFKDAPKKWLSDKKLILSPTECQHSGAIILK